MNINNIYQGTDVEIISLSDLVQQKRIEMKRGNVIAKTTGQYPVYSSSVQNNDFSSGSYIAHDHFDKNFRHQNR